MQPSRGGLQLCRVNADIQVSLVESTFLSCAGQDVSALSASDGAGPNRVSLRHYSFSDCVAKIRSTGVGKEATMYGPLRDLFIQVLDYPPSDVDIDTSGEGGRPDVTIRAPSGLVDANGASVKISWIVVEAKDEPGIFVHPERREQVFAQKSKYIGANTGWFVMVDPTVFIARQVGGRVQAADTVLSLDVGLDQAQFVASMMRLRAEFAGVPEQLKRFREGDEELIASEKLTPPDPADARPEAVSRYRITRKRFYSNLREATQHLQDACKHALLDLMPEVARIRAARDEFGMKYGGVDTCSFDSGTLMLKGRPQGPEQSRRHDREARALRREFFQAPYVARLALEGLPNFQSRTGADDSKVTELFAVDTGNLILARILLLRFLEDHGFFGERRYVCNGGVEAFQKMREYFAIGYTQLLEQAYRQASRLYAAAFDETELDWVFGSSDSGLSRSIEWSLFQFSRYDFTTIKGDLLTGIYDRFMDRDKRKELGEFYTPPSVARYIIRRVGLRPGDRVFDPACGSGTFLIEAYRELVGNDVDRGAAEFSDVTKTLANLCGNDINTFSSVLCQIQLLWQILGFKSDIQRIGFPDLPIASQVNSLVVPDQIAVQQRFGELDVPEYKAVIGNPPYVRKERSAQDLDQRTVAEFEGARAGFPGVSAKLNAYALFIYKALSSWCRPKTDSDSPGRLGFIVPVSLFDANENEGLRRLFAIGARWSIREVIDLELIYRHVFDADVLPAIIICENVPASEGDTISIRIATKDCVLPGEDGALPDFDFEGLPEEKVPYADAFTRDGRILTRLTEKRARIIRKLLAHQTFGDVAKPYWVRKHGSSVVEWSAAPTNAVGWERRQLISTGIAFRATRQSASGSGVHDIYKGENIVATELQGEPSIRRCDPASAEAPYIWQYASVLPHTAYAMAQMAHCPNAVRFDPALVAFTNTATIFIPDDRAVAVPFDLLLLSDVYVWFYALGARMGILRTCRSHIYPTNAALLPWSDELIAEAPAIEAMRDRIVGACRDAAVASEALLREVNELGYSTLKERLRSDKAARITFGENFEAAGYESEILTPHVGEDSSDDGIRVALSDDALDSVEINRSEIAHGLLRALELLEGSALGRAAILALSIPVVADEVAAWNSVVTRNSPGAIEARKRASLHELNVLVAQAFGLHDEDLEFIESDCWNDSFLKRIKPRYPGTVTRKQGFRTGLNKSSRYGS
jgi:SAM-dependent methyltransferase